MSIIKEEEREEEEKEKQEVVLDPRDAAAWNEEGNVKGGSEILKEEENENEDDNETVPLSIEEIDACASPENVKEFLKARIEETISESTMKSFTAAMVNHLC